METVVKAGQTFQDKVLECTGSIDNLFTMALLNGLSPTQPLDVGTVLKVSPVTNKAVVKMWVGNNIPASASQQITEDNTNDYLLPGEFPYKI